MRSHTPQRFLHLHQHGVVAALTGALSLLTLALLPWQGALVAVTLAWLGAWRWLKRRPLVAAVVRGAERLRDRAAQEVLEDPQDAPYVSTTLGIGLLVLAGLGASLAYQVAAVGVLEGEPVDWVAVFAFHVLWLGPNHLFFAHVTTLLHHHGHQRRIFAPRYRALDHFLVYVLGSVYGHVPESFSVGHVRNHHRYDNGPEDVLSTMAYDRGRLSAWLKYRAQFLLYWSGASVVWFFWRRGRRALALQQLRGVAFYYGLGLALLLVHPGLTLAYYVLPQLMIMNFLSAINYMWHGFIDPRDPGDPYLNALTIVGATQDCWNEAFHVSHHDRPSAKWVDMPDHFERCAEEYARRGALVFHDTQVMELFGLLMAGRVDLLAERARVVGRDLSPEELQDELRRRLQPL